MTEPTGYKRNENGYIKHCLLKKFITEIWESSIIVIKLLELINDDYCVIHDSECVSTIPIKVLSA